MVVTAKRDFPNLVQVGAVAGSAAATGGRRLLSVVLGAASENARANESQKLLNWGYTAWEAVKLFDANQPVASPAVWKGVAPSLGLGSTKAVIVTVPSGSGPKITTQIVRPDPLVAPFTKGRMWPHSRLRLASRPMPKCRWSRWSRCLRRELLAVPGMQSACGSNSRGGFRLRTQRVWIQ